MAWFKCDNNKRSANYTTSKELYDELESVSNTLFHLGVKLKRIIVGGETDDEGTASDIFVDFWGEKKDNFEAAADNIHTTAENLIDKVLPLILSYRNSLQMIGLAIDGFEDTNTSLSQTKAVQNDKLFSVNNSGTHDYSIEAVSGTEIITYKYTDVDGNVTEYTISELLNCFYTETGMSMSSLYTAAVASNDGVLSVDFQMKILSDTKAWIGEAHSAGAFGISSIQDINAVRAKYALPEEVQGLQTFKDETENLGIGDVMGTVSRSFGAGATLLGVYTLTNKFTENILKEEKTNSGASGFQSASTNSGTSSAGSSTSSVPQQATPSTSSVVQETTPVTQPQTQPATQPVTEVETEPITQPETKPTTVEEDDRLIQPEDDEIPTSPEVPTISPEDLDDMAKDEFFDKYGIEDLDNRRRQEAEEYERLYNMENRDELINKFKEMGYGDAEAVAAANNRDIGLAAFALGSQNKELTDIANRFAEEYGLTDKFNTSFDDKPDFTDLYDGDAQASLATPYRSDAVMEAKESVTTAKEAYTQSVASANSSIDKATKAKEEMNKVRASIEAKSGTDTSKWSDEDIEAYNKATENYNTAVTKANEDAAAAEAAKNAYNTAKDNLAKVEDDYYNNIKSGIQQQNGIVNGGSSPSANTQTDVGVTTDPNALPTDTSNSSNSSIPSNTGNLSNNISEPSTSSEAETTPDQDLLDAFLNL